jgi:hypothetical protein
MLVQGGYHHRPASPGLEQTMRTLTYMTLMAALAALPAAGRADAAPDSPWSLTMQGWGGVQRYDVLGLTHAVDTNGGRDLLDGSVRALGVSALFRIGWLDLGLLYEGSVRRQKTDTAIFTPLLGVRSNLSDYIRLDLLAELGGHQITNVGISDKVDASAARTVWLPYVGLRPTLSFTTPIGPLRAVFSLAPFVRWDLVGTTVKVKVSGVTSEVDSYEAGGSTYGVAVGAGVEL